MLRTLRDSRVRGGAGFRPERSTHHSLCGAYAPSIAARGGRVVVIIGPIKWSGQQVNYGSGKDVSDDTTADAGEPLEIHWFGASYVDLPVRRRR